MNLKETVKYVLGKMCTDLFQEGLSEICQNSLHSIEDINIKQYIHIKSF